MAGRSSQQRERRDQIAGALRGRVPLRWVLPWVDGRRGARERCARLCTVRAPGATAPRMTPGAGIILARWADQEPFTAEARFRNVCAPCVPPGAFSRFGVRPLERRKPCGMQGFLRMGGTGLEASCKQALSFV
jgi:hypothetical protein